MKERGVRWRVLAIVGALLIVVGAGLLLTDRNEGNSVATSGGSDSTNTAEPGTTTGGDPAIPDTTAGEDPAGPDSTPTGGQASDRPIPELEPVGTSKTVRTQNDLVIRVDRVFTAKSDGSGIGEISGKAIAFKISVENVGDQPFDLGSVSVAASLGPNRIPASPLATTSVADHFSGDLAPGATATGVYTFLYPTAGERAFVEVAYADGEPLVVFYGKP